MTLIIIIITGGIILFLLLGFLIQGPPFVASDDIRVKQILKLVRGCNPNRIIDLGCGDGKIVIALAQDGFHTEGVEFNPWLVFRGRRAIKRNRLQDKATIHWGNLWTFDVKRYDLVIVYAIKHVMPKLELKLYRELPIKSVIISNYFEFPTKKPITKHGDIVLYEV
jgi:ribosomal protein L11 methylase PrmA